MKRDIRQVLPEPFEWIFISGGYVDLQYPPHRLVKQYSVKVDDFFIAKYPITNAQYGVYLQESGERIDRQEIFDQPQFNQPLQPVISVRWYEAILFCQWLSKIVGYDVILPTDAQWQRAAQGDDNRIYPWGNNWDSDSCNSTHNDLGHTTPVTQYPQGASPFGVMDMVGNVNEWCSTDAKTGHNIHQLQESKGTESKSDERIFRGGSYNSSYHSTNVISSGSTFVYGVSYLCGIRLVKR